jgi:hypothetical protein
MATLPSGVAAAVWNLALKKKPVPALGRIS